MCCALIAGWLILLTPIHGYSDNGDFQRFMATNDLYSLHQVQAGYVVQQYGLMKYYNPLHLEHLTVQSVVIQLAVGLNRLFYSHSRFDIRFLGAVHYGLYLGGVAVLVKGLVGEKKVGYETTSLQQSQRYLSPIRRLRCTSTRFIHRQ